MLSFLREQEIADSQVREPAAAGNRADNAGDVQQQADHKEYLTVAARGKNVRKTTCLLAVVFGIGLLCLLFMIKKSAPQAATGATSATETKIETAIQRLTGIKSEVFSRMDQIVKKFYEFSDVKQVNVSELAKDPFKRDLLLDGLEPLSGAEDDHPDADSVRLQQIMLRAKDLQLLSIMRSKQGNCCMINNKILYEGDLIKDFRVCQISDALVKLRCEQDTILQKDGETGPDERASENMQTDPMRDNGYLGTEIILKLSD